MWISALQVKGLDVDTLYVSHIQVNQAQKQRRRTYRAHGRINRKSSIWSRSLQCYERFFICSLTSCLPTWCSLHVLPVPHRAHLVGEGRAREERGMWLYTLCAWLFESKQGIMLCYFGQMVSSSGWVPDRNQEGLEKGGHLLWTVIGLSENFGWLLFTWVVCKCFVTLITARTAHTIHQSWELSEFSYLYWCWCQWSC